MNKNTKAPEEYKKAKAQCEALLNRVKSGLKTHKKPKEDLHYGHVGSLNYVKEQLENICEFLNA